jgi:hypothetical protein
MARPGWTGRSAAQSVANPAAGCAPFQEDDVFTYRVGFAAAGALIALSTAALASEIKPGQPYQGQIVACAIQQEAETLRGFVIAGELAKAKDYLKANDNTCGVGSVRFIPEELIGQTKIDASGNAWSIVKIVLPTAEAFLVTTADFVVGQAT